MTRFDLNWAWPRSWMKIKGVRSVPFGVGSYGLNGIFIVG